VLVTGGAGFIGSHLVRRLLAQGHSVVAYDDFSVGRRESLPATVSSLAVAEGDIRDEGRLRELFQLYRPWAVVHLAAVHFIPFCSAHPAETLAVNVVGTQSLLEVSSKADIGHFVFASSAAVYAPSDRSHREDDPTGPIDIYGLSKVFGEMLATAFHEQSGTPTHIARIFNVYGPGDNNLHVIPEIVQQLATGSVLQLGNLEARRDYIHVTDVARSLELLLDESPSPFGIFNIGTGRTYSVAHIVELFRDCLDREIRVESREERLRPVDRPFLQADITRIAKTFAWRPQIEPRQGLAELVRPLTLSSQAATARVGR
jgi:UDP-glucose 4-epimerase